MVRPRVLLLALGWAALAAERPELEAYRGKPPKLDGRIARGEYADAVMFHGPGGWMSQFSPVRDAGDLSFTGYVKHDGRRLYFAFDVTDDLLYGIDTPRWLPDNNPKAHELTRDGWPWFGDEFELLIHAGAPPVGEENAAGDGSSWQMVCNLTKSRLGGVGKGGLLEGEPRSDARAFATYRQWIETRAMECAARPKPGGGGYVIEWAVSFQPCLEIAPGVFYDPAAGDRRVGLNIAAGDLDRKETGAGNFGNFHHEEWFAGRKGLRTQLREWGTLWIRNRPKPSAPR